ncbi:hypothetical protein Tco_1153757 [Tanacetum coccineum]
MAKELDEHQQQVMLDAALVPINKQVKILTSNFRISLEKIQLDAINKVCLEILKQYSFYNAFIGTADALEIYMQCLTGKAGAYDRLRLPMLQLLWGMVTSSNIDFAELIWEDFKHQTDPVFGMAIPVVILNDNINASAKYLKYLKKAIRARTPVVKGGKGLVSKKGVKIVVEQISIPKTRRSKTITEEVDESEQMDDLGDYEETEEEEVIPLVIQRSTGVVIGREAHRESEVEKERSEGSGITLEAPDELVHKSSNEGARVNPEVLDKFSSSSSSSSYDFEFVVEDISSDEDEITKKADNAKIANVEKDIEDQVTAKQVAKKQAGGEEHSTDQGGNEPASDAHADVQMAEAQPQKPKETQISSSQTLSSIEFTNQFLDEHA